MLFFYFYSIYSTTLINEYENNVKDENIYDKIILVRTRNNLLVGEVNIFENLDICCNISLVDNIDTFIELISNFENMTRNLLTSILNFKFDKHLLKLIFSIKLEENSSVSNYVVHSFITTKLIQNLIIVSSSEKIIKDNFDLWKDFIKATSDDKHYNVFLNTIYITGCIENDSRSLQICVFNTIILKHWIELKERYQKVIDDHCNYLDNYNIIEVGRLLDVPYFKTSFFELIKEKMDSFKNLHEGKYYFLFNHRGFPYNRICTSSLIDLYKNKCYKSFTNCTNIIETDIDNTEIDISYLEGKEFKFQKEEEFEYTMGLLQYVSCRYKKHIICILERDHYGLKIINASNPPFEMILDHFKNENDITQEVEDNHDKYFDKYFVSILERKEYRFAKNKDDLVIPSKCLKLTCSHIIGNDLLREYISDLSQRCYLCNTEVEIEAYFEVNLYTKSYENLE